jgi:hypothetical protein
VVGRRWGEVLACRQAGKQTELAFDADLEDGLQVGEWDRRIVGGMVSRL